MRTSVLKRKKDAAETEWSCVLVMCHVICTEDATCINQNGGSPVRTSVLERKKETADVELSRLLRKPRKRNGAGFF